LNGLIEHVQFCENTGIKVQVANNASISDYFNIFVDSEDFEGNQQICRAICSEKS
jgi:hypothetical protein